MTLRLTPESLAAAYEYLRTTAPFDKWNLPEAEDVRFRIIRNPKLFGYYNVERGRHVIAVSVRAVGHTASLMSTMAHEMIHLHQKHAGMETKGEHNAAFVKLAARVAKIHGFDPKAF